MIFYFYFLFDLFFQLDVFPACNVSAKDQKACKDFQAFV